jgi:hypothetical protein
MGHRTRTSKGPLSSGTKGPWLLSLLLLLSESWLLRLLLLLRLLSKSSAAKHLFLESFYFNLWNGKLSCSYLFKYNT